MIQSHPQRPRGGQSGQEKRRDESLQVRVEAPNGYWLSQDHFQTVKRMLAPDWAQKMLCIIVPNQRTVSPEFFSWVRTRQLLSRHSYAVRSPSFPNQTKELPMSGKTFRMQFNLHWENSVSDGSQCIVNNRKFKMRRWQESKKSNSSTRKNNNFAHASHFVVHFFAVTAGLPRENA